MVLLGVPRKKSPVTPPGIDPGTVLLAAQCLNHYATPDPLEGKGTRNYLANRLGGPQSRAERGGKQKDFCDI